MLIILKNEFIINLGNKVGSVPMNMKKRWYDRHKSTEKAFKLLKELDFKSQYQIAQDVMSIAGAIKTSHKEEDAEQPISIGLDRVLGLYQAGNMRRWYDKYPYLNQAILTISTLPEEDYVNIMEGLSDSLQPNS